MKKKKTKKICGLVPENIDEFDMPIICGKKNFYTSPSPKKTFRFIKILCLVTLLILGTIYLPRLFDNNIKSTKELQNTTIPVISQSICDEVIKQTELIPVKKYDSKPAKVDFSTNPDAKVFYTTITQQATESANFAGHFNFVSWGCGTNCAGFAVIDSITGKIVDYMPFDEEGNSYSYNVNSRLLVLNPKSDYEKYNGKTVEEITQNDGFLTDHIRKYYNLVESGDGVISLDKICTENVLDGIYALDGKTEKQVVYYAKLTTISTAREARFYWYDTELKKIKSPDDKYAWFWAMPQKFFDDTKISDQWFKFMDENNDEVFKITGTRLKDDCDYYDSDHCIEDIDVKKIEVVDKNLKLEY